MDVAIARKGIMNITQEIGISGVRMDRAQVEGGTYRMKQGTARACALGRAFWIAGLLTVAVGATAQASSPSTTSILTPAGSSPYAVGFTAESATPEPSTWAMTLGPFAGLAAWMGASTKGADVLVTRVQRARA
jgi:hypothetical protein